MYWRKFSNFIYKFVLLIHEITIFFLLNLTVHNCHPKCNKWNLLIKMNICYSGYVTSSITCCLLVYRWSIFITYFATFSFPISLPTLLARTFSSDESQCVCVRMFNIIVQKDWTISQYSDLLPSYRFLIEPYYKEKL